MVIGFVQGYEELKWGISKLNPLCNGPSQAGITTLVILTFWVRVSKFKIFKILFFSLFFVPMYSTFPSYLKS